VLSGGENVDPEAVEAALDAHSAIAESGVLEDDGALAAVLVPAPGIARDTDADALPGKLREAAAAALADAPDRRRPTRIEIDHRPLPRTRLGKLRRQRLRERCEALRRGDAEPAATGLIPTAELAPNHESALDPIAIAAVLPTARRRNTFWGGFTGRMFHTPWMRLVSRAFRVLPVAPEQRPITSLAYGAAALARGGMLVWFPEGRRSAGDEIRPFRAGIGSLARAQGVPVVPCLLRNTGAALPPGAPWPRRRRLALRIGAAVDAATLAEEGSGDDPAERIADAVRRRVLALKD
jgi:hypothetical protein